MIAAKEAFGKYKKDEGKEIPTMKQLMVGDRILCVEKKNMYTKFSSCKRGKRELAITQRNLEIFLKSHKEICNIISIR